MLFFWGELRELKELRELRELKKLHDRLGNAIAVVAFCDKAGGLLDGLLGVAGSTGNASQSHNIEVVISIATT